ncbi:MAG: DUF6352 family protein [Bacillota bacterium]
MAQDFWASSGYALLAKRGDRVVATPAWLARFLARAELLPPPEAGPRERELHGRLAADPCAPIGDDDIASVEDPDARDNWRAFRAFRDRVLAHPSLEDAYLAIFRAPNVDIAPELLDAIVRSIARAMLDGSDDPWMLRAAEMLFRPQRVASEGGQLLAADAGTLEASAQAGPARMAVLTHENAGFYWLRDELHSFALDLTPGREGAAALARVLERWIARLARVRVSIEPLARIEDEPWRWHVGLDAEASAILDALYRGEAVAPETLERLIALFRLRFADPFDAREDVRGRPVYLALAVRPDRTLRLKPQNLLASLPFSAKAEPAAG